MKALLKAGHALLIQGPAVARVLSGNGSTLGKPLELDEPLVVRAGRLKIIEAQDETELDIVTGEGGKLDEVKTSTIPREWSDFVKKIATKKPGKLWIMVLGGVDTGKNTFITYSCNTLLKEGLRVAVMDADMGQGEIGPPTSMSIAFVESTVSELLDLSPKQIFFVGSTSPASVVGRVLHGAEKLMSFVNENALELTMFINMPGWVTGPGATVFILEMISRLKISCLVALQRESEVEDVLNGVPPNLEVARLPASSYAKMRSREERKFLRETSYRKYFADSKQIGARYDKIDFSPLFSSRGKEASEKVASDVEHLVKSRVLYCEEADFSINAIVAKYGDISAELVDEDDYQQQYNQAQSQTSTQLPTKKEIRVIPEVGLSGLMVALFGKDDSLLSLGILRKIDFGRKRATITATVKLNEVARIEVGKVKVSPQGYEIGYVEIRRVAASGDSKANSASKHGSSIKS